ncbi:MAG: carboxymuconolactone decarboxylase family protein [Gemmatimonadales bacterium]
MTLKPLDAPTRAWVAFAAALAKGSEPLIEERASQCSRSRVPLIWMDELLLQSVLICGWPRALTAARIWRQTGAGAVPQEAENGSDYGRVTAWRARGESVCRTVYGEKYAALRRNIHALHPDLEAGMIGEGYGRILGRPGLDLARRELAVVAQIAVLGARRQLRSHFRGALNAGATAAAVRETLEVVRPLITTEEWNAILGLWERVQQ